MTKRRTEAGLSRILDALEADILGASDEEIFAAVVEAGPTCDIEGSLLPLAIAALRHRIAAPDDESEAGEEPGLTIPPLFPIGGAPRSR
jgi:hypothetical protein